MAQISFAFVLKQNQDQVISMISVFSCTAKQMREGQAWGLGHPFHGQL